MNARFTPPPLPATDKKKSSTVQLIEDLTQKSDIILAYKTPVAQSADELKAPGGVDPADQVTVFDAPTGRYGCMPHGWDLMTQLLGGIEHLLPTVMNPHVWNARGFTQKGARQLAGASFGKTPSQVGPNGAHGFLDWPRRETTEADIEQWRTNPDLGILVRCNGPRVLDIDSEREDVVKKMLAVVEKHLGPERWSHTPIRYRDNSSRASVMFKVDGRVPSKKVALLSDMLNIGDVDPGAGLFELLGDNKQSSWAGTHKSGARLLHRNLSALSAPKGLPVLTVAEAMALWDDLVQNFAADPESIAGFFEGKPGGAVEGMVVDDPVGQWLLAQGLVHEESGGKLHIDCAFQDQHESTPGVTRIGSASWLPAKVRADGTTAEGRPVCLHAGCKPDSDDRWKWMEKLGVPRELYRKPAAAQQPNVDAFTGIPAPANLAPGVVTVEPAPAKPMRYRNQVVSLKDSVNLPMTRWMIKDVLPCTGTCMVYGQTRAGKTFVVIDLAMHLLTKSKTEWFGRRIRNRPTGVFYFAMEDLVGARTRARAWAKEHDCELPANFQIFDGNDFDLTKTQDAEDIAQVILDAIGEGALFVVDTQIKAAPGADEQSSRDTSIMYKNLQRIAETVKGIAMPVAHAGKDVTLGVRGSSAQIAACDMAIVVKNSGDARTWVVDKNKSGPGGETGHFTIRRCVVGVDEEGDEIDGGVLVPRNAPTVAKVVQGNDLLVFQAFEATAVLVGEDNPVQEKAWRRNFYALYADKKTDAKQEAMRVAFKRGLDVLVDQGSVKEAPGGGYLLGIGIASPFPALPRTVGGAHDEGAS